MIKTTFALLASLAVQATSQQFPPIAIVATTPMERTHTQSARPKALTPLYALYGGLATSQFAATKIALNRGAREANPFMGFNGSPALQAGAAIGAGVFTIWIAEHEWKRGHRARAIAMMAMVTAINGAILIHDVRWLNKYSSGRAN